MLANVGETYTKVKVYTIYKVFFFSHRNSIQTKVLISTHWQSAKWRQYRHWICSWYLQTRLFPRPAQSVWTCHRNSQECSDPGGGTRGQRGIYFRFRCSQRGWRLPASSSPGTPESAGTRPVWRVEGVRHLTLIRFCFRNFEGNEWRPASCGEGTEDQTGREVACQAAAGSSWPTAGSYLESWPTKWLEG